MPIGCQSPLVLLFFFFNDTATTEIYTLSLHDALPICADRTIIAITSATAGEGKTTTAVNLATALARRSEEHTSELQSLTNLVCRLLLEKKKDTIAGTSSAR